MSRSSPAIAIPLLAVALLLPGISRADDQDTIDYRQHVMKTMGELSAAIGQILQQKVPPDNLVSHAQTLAIAAKMAKMAFQPDMPGGEAKPEIWSNWADFSKRLDDLTAYTEAVAAAAKEGGAPAAGAKIAASHVCKDCHDLYRQQKK